MNWLQHQIQFESHALYGRSALCVGLHCYYSQSFAHIFVYFSSSCHKIDLCAQIIWLRVSANNPDLIWSQSDTQDKLFLLPEQSDEGSDCWWSFHAVNANSWKEQQHKWENFQPADRLLNFQLVASTRGIFVSVSCTRWQRLDVNVANLGALHWKPHRPLKGEAGRMVCTMNGTWV